ncbi:MAG: hypothetical protein JNM89_05615 [Hyphomicrobiaceae bacterium]|nr:hypothetical protein [Hyphomicrobiaceae bacterium]
MLVAVAGLVIATVVIAAVWLVPRLGRGRVLFDAAPDGPHPFGYDMSWLALRTADTDAVADMLGVADASPANWNSGLGTVYDRQLGATRIFISPPVDGWTFVIGLALPHPTGAAFADKCTPLLVRLASRFPEVQLYSACPVVDLFAWVRLVDRDLVRAFATLDGEVVWSKGRRTREEQALGLRFFELRGVAGRSGDAGSGLVLTPTDTHVMQIAGRWSKDPTALRVADAPPALGLVALAPRSWAAERLRQSA